MATTETMPILVTGATGFAGGRLALHLRRQGRTVRALVRPTASASALAALRDAGVELVSGDLRQLADVERAAAGVATIYHLAAVHRTAGHPDSYYEDINVGGTEHVVEAAARHGVARLVHCSTIAVHGTIDVVPATEESPLRPGDIYETTKLRAEEAVQAAIAAGLSAVIFRPAGMYGPGDLRFLKLFKAVNSGRFVMFGKGRACYHLVYIDDLIRGILLCGEHPAALGRTFIIAGENWVTLSDWVAEIARALAVPEPRLRLPFWPLAAAAVACERLCEPFGIEPPLHRRRAQFFVKNRAFSIERARRVLGYAPEVTLAEGVRRTAAWYVDQGLLTPKKSVV